MFYPEYRPRRLRQKDVLRKMISETVLSVNNLIYPMFVVYGKNKKSEIKSMPDNYHFSVDKIIREAEEVYNLGIPAIILFGIPEKKDEKATQAYSDNGIVQQAVRAIKSKIKKLIVITDVCLCEYMSHGHCGIVKKFGKENFIIDNDSTLELLAKTALSHVNAGADMVAPSDMMDGRVAKIRKILDENGHEQIPIMSYSAKYSSGFYGPFRKAVESAPKFGDRTSYQMDPANSDEALREAFLDIKEGADIIMVKPALPYLDIIYRIKKEFKYPVSAYNVSGEYSMLVSASKMGWLDYNKVMMESLLSIKRAGADLILTYFAKDAAKIMKA